MAAHDGCRRDRIGRRPDLLVLLTGGGRFYLGDVRVSVTSPGRMLLAAGLLVVARHLTYPHPSLRARVRVGLGWARRAADTGGRGGLDEHRGDPAAGAAGRVHGSHDVWAMVGRRRSARRRTSSGTCPLAGTPAGISASRPTATSGVRTAVDTRTSRSFPRILCSCVPAPPCSAPTRRPSRAMWSVGRPSPVSCCRSSPSGGPWRICTRLARQTLDAERSRAAVLLTAAYPFAVLLRRALQRGTVPAGERGRVLSLPAARNGARPGAWGLLAGLTRPNGCLLSVPLGLLAVMEGIRSYRAQPGDGSTARQAGWWRASLRGLGAAAMPGVGMLVFSAYIMSLTGHPFTWIEAHEAWGRSYRGPGELVAGLVPRRLLTRPVSLRGERPVRSAEPDGDAVRPCPGLAGGSPVRRRVWGLLGREPVAAPPGGRPGLDGAHHGGPLSPVPLSGVGAPGRSARRLDRRQRHRPGGSPPCSSTRGAGCSESRPTRPRTGSGGLTARGDSPDAVDRRGIVARARGGLVEHEPAIPGILDPPAASAGPPAAFVRRRISTTSCDDRV